MPFNVAYSAYRNQVKGIITYFDAGPDQIVTCNSDVTLTATIIGNTKGHTLFWEQISGTPVTWTTPVNQQIVNYTSVDVNNKVFRFYLDKGTSAEKFDDVNNFKNPVSIIDLSTITASTSVSYLGNTGCEKPQNMNSVEECAGTQVDIIFNNASCQLTYLQGYELELLQSGSWQSVDTIFKGEPTIFYDVSVGNDIYYRIAAIYYFGNNVYEKSYTDRILLDKANSVVISGETSVITPGISSSGPDHISGYKSNIIISKDEALNVTSIFTVTNNNDNTISQYSSTVETK